MANPPGLPASVTLTDDIYWAAQPVAVQAIRAYPVDGPDRGAKAVDLAKQGYKIDFPIMVWGWNAPACMFQRQIDGLTWVPNALQPSIGLSRPDSSNPPYDPYDPNNQPAGSITVSVDAVDYPPVAPVGSKPALPKVGNAIAGDMYAQGPGSVDPETGRLIVANGDVVAQDGVEYTAEVYAGGLGVIYHKIQGA